MTAPHDNFSQSNTAGGANQFAPHDKLSGIKPGDRVLVTHQGVVTSEKCSQYYSITFPGDDKPSLWIAPDLDDKPTIERIEPPLKVGDRVRWSESYTGAVHAQSGHIVHGVILAIADGYALLKAEQFGHKARPLSDLERIA